RERHSRWQTYSATSFSLFLRRELSSWVRILSFSVHHSGLPSGTARLQRIDSGNRSGAAQFRPRRHRRHVWTSNQSVSIEDSADELHFPGRGPGDPFVSTGILWIYWDGISVSAGCRRRWPRIYSAEHGRLGRDSSGAFRSSNGNDLHVSVCRRCDWSLRGQRSSQLALSPPTRFQIVRNPIVICATTAFGEAGCGRTNRADRQRPGREPGGTSPSGILRIVRGGIHRHATVECDTAGRDRDPGDNAAGKEGRN